MAEYECDCWRTDPALAADGGVPRLATPPCVLEMTLDPTLATKKNKKAKKQKQPKKVKKPANRAAPGKCRRCCGRFFTFLFSHIGLCALVIGYSIMGAFAFRALESPYEEQKAFQVSQLRQDTVRRLWEITDKLNVLYKDNWTGLVEAEVRRFQKDLILAVKEGYDGKEGPGQQWSFSGAFLYSLTVITTIGYGNIAPKTNWGKLVTILYAIFGIPLMFLYLTNIGNILAKSFKYVYGRIFFRRRLGDQRRGRQQQLEQYQIHHIMLQDATSPNAGANSIVDSSTLIRNKLNSDLTKDDLDDEGVTNYTKPRVTVPITLCLSIIAGYICGGAAIFSVWEGWDYLDGSYFCFVTLSTIGFGDLVPGDSVVTDEGTQEKLVICSLYLLAGMALIAMCFNLVQEEVVFKLRKIGRSLGLVNDRDDDD